MLILNPAFNAFQMPFVQTYLVMVVVLRMIKGNALHCEVWSGWYCVFSNNNNKSKMRCHIVSCILGDQELVLPLRNTWIQPCFVWGSYCICCVFHIVVCAFLLSILSCLSRVGGSLQVLRLPPSLQLVAVI